MLTNGQIAQVCHAANKAYCESIGDFTQPRWEDLPLEKKESLVNGVKLILNNPESNPEDSHKAWLKTMKKDGWSFMEKEIIEPVIVRGKKTNKTKVTKVPLPKDWVKKCHPNMIPYDELPEEQKFKDVLFRAVVRSFVVEGEEGKAKKK